MRGFGVFLAVVLLSACGCKNGDKRTGGTGNGNGNGNGKPVPTAAECDGLRDKIVGLYATPAPPDESAEAAALRQQEQKDNTDMVLADCRKDPARVVPCARTAVSTDQLERACLLPLDDEGNAEQKQFAQ